MWLALADEMVPAWLYLSQASILDQPLLLDLGAFDLRPMGRRMNNAREKVLRAIEPGPPQAN